MICYLFFIGYVYRRVTKGVEILKEIDAIAASADGKPAADVWISDCGLI